MRSVYDVAADALTMVGSHPGRSLITAASMRLTPERDALSMTASFLRRPARLGEPVCLLRVSTLVSGAAPLAPLDTTSLLAAYRSAACRLVRSFGAAAVVLPTPDGGHGGPPSSDGGAGARDGAGQPPVFSNAVATEYSSAAVASRLQAQVLGRLPVHPGGLRFCPAAVVPARPALGQSAATALWLLLYVISPEAA